MTRYHQILSTHSFNEYFDVANFGYARKVNSFFERAIAWDMGENGDITARALVPLRAKALGTVIAKEEGVLAGSEEINFFLEKSGTNLVGSLRVTGLAEDGDDVYAGMPVMKIEGNARDLLVLERSLLNFVQRLSGIATYTRKIVGKVPKGVLICPTRKTLWGVLDKKGSLAGGGGTHRLDLSDAYLIKSNHVGFAGGIEKAIEKVFKIFTGDSVGRFFEVEVRSSAEAAAAAGVLARMWSTFDMKGALPVMMFDNFAAADIKTAVEQMKNSGFYEHMAFEASGGINERNIKDYANTGVDILSLGSITHSSRALDFSMNITQTD